ncbi:MAG: SsrA-binding protein SmpB [Armatimonadetes bacterium]|nr:SsrA-binding protein SmpB [Armatimonadota bacterium]
MSNEQKHKNISITNRKARHEYHIGETFEAGLVLVGTEVKSIRAGQASITEAYCKMENGEIFIYGMHVAPFEQGNRFNVDPLRPRKLLLRRGEINRISRQLAEKGLTLIPLKVFFSRGYAKMNIGLARGKKLWDKRESITQRDTERERLRQESERY